MEVSVNASRDAQSDQSSTAVRQLMSRMHKDGQLSQEGYGKYVPSRGPGHIAHTSHSSTDGPGVTSVTTVTPPYREKPDGRHLSADEANERAKACAKTWRWLR